jgi:D-alanyl-lipoteichoic acid acyltransferase DltB (MBOAT superfamily)
MKVLSTASWEIGDLFTRFFDIFSWNVGDGSSLVFTKLDFWLFFLLVMLVFSFLHKQKLVRSIFLTMVSLFFFYKTSGLYMLLLIVSVTFNYALGNQIFVAKKESSRKWIIAISAIFNLLILGYFKYAYFFTDSFNQMFQSDFELVNHFAQFGNSFWGEGTFVEKILLPVGVSFFTFQNISYVVDIYRKEIEPVKNFFHYSFFVTFFPQLVMGPIVRARDFIPQIANPFRLDKNDFSWAVIQIVKGLIKKIVIADFLVVHFIDKIVFDFEIYPGFVSVIAMWAYSIHIYADFSGYTDIAIGLSRLMGFKLKPNFNSPYKAINVADFWRRWHISLGSWLKDYLYIPLGGNRTGGIGSYIAIIIIFIFLIFITQWYDLLWVYGGVTILYLLGVALVKDFKRYVHRDLNLIITMVVGGLWHGPSENFVIWGAMNGCALLVYKYWKKISFYEHSKTWIAHFWKIFITFNFITFTRIWFKLDEARMGPFKEAGLSDAEADKLPMKMLDQIWNHFDFTWDYFMNFIDMFQVPLIIMIAGFIVHWLPDKLKKLGEKTYTAMPIPVQGLIIVITVFLMYQAIGAEQPPFVYLQF